VYARVCGIETRHFQALLSTLHAGMATTTEVRHRNLGLAREAYACTDQAVGRQLSREAHSLLEGDSPRAPAGEASSWISGSEAGHNEELANRATTLVLRAALDGVVLSATLLSLGQAAAWPARKAVAADFILLGCWAAYSACREALEIGIYWAYYKRERAREAWGARRVRPLAIA
jgi:hypothetical protein